MFNIQQIEDLAQEVCAEEDFAQVCSKAQNILENLGVCAINIGIATNNCNDLIGIFSSMSDQFLAHYFEQDFVLDDPFIKHLQMQRPEILLQGFNTPQKSWGVRGDLIMNTARDAGYPNFFFKPVILSEQKNSAWLTLINDMPDKEAGAHLAEFKDVFSIACAIIGTRAAKTLNAEKAGNAFFRFGTDALAPRQLEVIQWLANGLRTDQIADKMNIKPVTVNMHLNAAKTKLKAKSREHLIATAFLHKIL